MRIVYLTQRLPFGDGETFIVPEVNALLADGHEVLVVPLRAVDPVIHDDARLLLDRTRTLPAAPVVAAAAARLAARSPRRTAGAYWRLRRTRPRRRALANAVATTQAMWLARLAERWRADHIHAHWAHLPATSAMSASAVSGIPWSFTAHRYDVVLGNLLAEKLRSARFGRFIAWETFALAGAMVPPDAMRRAIVLHMGVPLPSIPLPEPGPRNRPIVFCPARFVPVKGHRYLLEAVARLRARGCELELRLAGAGPEQAGLEGQAQRLRLGDRVRWLGTLPHAELLRLYREGGVDCTVLPSLDLGDGLHEGISVALMEAMAHGVPAIGTRTGGLPELLGGGAGVLVPPADPSALADALEGLLQSPRRRAELGRAGRRRVEQQFDVRVIAHELARRFAAPAP